ncbi:MAG: pur operon repressor [Clostridiales bacterium]|nr:pur operon repressor [Clostridiales bacterium]
MLRTERIAAITRMLCDSPGRIFNLGSFAEKLGSAKSSLSEDIDIVRTVLEKFGMGKIETIPGAAGGVRYTPSPGSDKVAELFEMLGSELSKKERILPGGYLYMLDLIFNPELVSEIGMILADYFRNAAVDYVVTVETKGIPLAFMTARYLDVPLVVVRHYNEETDGASVNINYVSGSSKKIQTMVLPLRSLKRNSRLLFIDDFMKGGGTAKGILDLAREFDCEVVGTGVLIKTREPVKKLTDKYFSILTLNSVDEQEGKVDIVISQDL